MKQPPTMSYIKPNHSGHIGGRVIKGDRGHHLKSTQSDERIREWKRKKGRLDRGLVVRFDSVGGYEIAVDPWNELETAPTNSDMRCFLNSQHVKLRWFLDNETSEKEYVTSVTAIERDPSSCSGVNANSGTNFNSFYDKKTPYKNRDHVMIRRN